MASRVLRSLFFILVSFFVSGCTVRRYEIPVEFRGTTPLEDTARASIVRQLNEQVRALTTFKAVAELELRKFPSVQHLRQILLFDRQSKAIRIEIFDKALHRLLALIVMHEGQLQALDVEKKRVLVGAASSRNIEKLLAVSLSPEELMLFLSGRFPGAENSSIIVRSAGSDGRYLVESAISSQQRIYATITNQLGELRLDSVVIAEDRSREVLTRATYTYSGQTLFKIDIELPPRGMSSVLEFTDQSTNVPIDSTKFSLRIPERYPVLSLDTEEVSGGIGPLPEDYLQ